MRLADISSPNAEKPVRVPPGRARLWNSSGSLCTAGSAIATTGIFVLRTAARAEAGPGANSTSTGMAANSSMMACPRAISPLAIAHVDDDVAPLDITEIGQRLAERRDNHVVERRACEAEVAHYRNAACAVLLRQRVRAATPPPRPTCRESRAASCPAAPAVRRKAPPLAISLALVAGEGANTPPVRQALP